MRPELGWLCFAKVDNALSAQVVADYLIANDCPAELTASPFPDIQAGVEVRVPAQLIHRARWLWFQTELSDAEFHFLVSGELPGGPP